jgi:hypothetical protein
VPHCRLAGQSDGGDQNLAPMMMCSSQNPDVAEQGKTRRACLVPRACMTPEKHVFDTTPATRFTTVVGEKKCTFAPGSRSILPVRSGLVRSLLHLPLGCFFCATLARHESPAHRLLSKCRATRRRESLSHNANVNSTGRGSRIEDSSSLPLFTKHNFTLCPIPSTGGQQCLWNVHAPTSQRPTAAPFRARSRDTWAGRPLVQRPPSQRWPMSWPCWSSPGYAVFAGFWPSKGCRTGFQAKDRSPYAHTDGGVARAAPVVCALRKTGVAHSRLSASVCINGKCQLWAELQWARSHRARLTS